MPTVLRCIFLVLMSVSPVWAIDRGSAALCISAAERAAAESGVPVRLLRAITLVETQHHGLPWPWSLNIEGTGHRYPSRDAAVEAAREALDQTQSVDIGCFQINTKWHAGGFSSLEEMFDPEANARYAANHLLELHRQKGTWTEAVAHYHSGDAEMGRRYVERVGAFLADDSDRGEVAPDTRPNGFPLFIAGGDGALGSLVPRQPGRAPLIGGP